MPETHYRATAQLASADAVPYFNLGVLLEDLKRPREAVECYKQSLARNPDFADAHYNLGLLLENLGNKKEAFTHLRAARKLYMGK